MTSTITLLLVLTAASPQGLVVISRRSGVSVKAALETVATTNEVLRTTPASEPDATSCKARKPCLLALARRASAAVLVTVELGGVLDDVTLRIEALSVDEDGKSLGTVQLEGTAQSVRERLRGELETKVRPSVDALLGPATPVIVQTTPTPAVVAPVEPGPPMPIAPPMLVTQEVPFFSGARAVGFGVIGLGLASLVTSGVFFGESGRHALQSTSLCPTGTACTSRPAFDEWSSAARAQQLAIGFGIGGAAGVAVGALIALINPGGTVRVSMAPTPGGLFAAVDTTW